MDLVAIVVGFVLLGVATTFVLRPFRAKAHVTSSGVPELMRPDESRKAALSALRDLDFDFRTGKVNEEDYPALRAELVAQAAKSIEKVDEEDDRIEALIRARKMAGAGGIKCPKCGSGLTGSVHFCPHCGAELGTTCPSCGRTTKPGDLFCSSCGSKVQQVRDEVAV